MNAAEHGAEFMAQEQRFKILINQILTVAEQDFDPGVMTAFENAYKHLVINGKLEAATLLNNSLSEGLDMYKRSHDYMHERAARIRRNNQPPTNIDGGDAAGTGLAPAIYP